MQKGSRYAECELRFHDESYGWEAQFFRDGEFVAGRRFDLKAQAIQWAELERQELEREGWPRWRSGGLGGKQLTACLRDVSSRYEPTGQRPQTIPVSTSDSDNCTPARLGDGEAVADRGELAGVVPVDRVGALCHASIAGVLSRAHVSTAPYGHQSSREGHDDCGERSLLLYPQSDVSQPARALCGWYARVSIALGCGPLRPRVSRTPLWRHHSRGETSRSRVWRALQVVSAARPAVAMSGRPQTPVEHVLEPATPGIATVHRLAARSISVSSHSPELTSCRRIQVSPSAVRILK
jgi:hypothetical protein